MNNAKFKGLLSSLRDIAAILAIVWTVAVFTVPASERWVQRTFGLKAWYHLADYRICIRQKAEGNSVAPENVDAFADVLGQAFHDDAVKYCWQTVNDEPMICAVAPAPTLSRICAKPDDTSDGFDQWLTPQMVGNAGFAYGFETNIANFHHLDWKDDPIAAGYRADAGYDATKEQAESRFDIVNGIVFVEQRSQDPIAGRQLATAGDPADVAAYFGGAVKTIANPRDCLYVAEIRHAGARAASADYPNNVFARMVKVDCG